MLYTTHAAAGFIFFLEAGGGKTNCFLDEERQGEMEIGGGDMCIQND